METSNVETENYELFRDCLAQSILPQQAPSRVVSPQKRKNQRTKRPKRKADHEVAKTTAQESQASDAEDLAEFIDPTTYAHLAEPIDTSTLNNLTSHIPPGVADSLIAYILPTTSPSFNSDPGPADVEISSFLATPLTSYLTTLLTPPPTGAAKHPRPSDCELCSRSWIPLTAHHLIPRSAGAKAVKRGWHSEERLTDLAWLCRACHDFVHRSRTNEELAREFSTVDRLRGLDGVEEWVGWIGGVRWKKK